MAAMTIPAIKRVSFYEPVGEVARRVRIDFDPVETVEVVSSSVTVPVEEV